MQYQAGISFFSYYRSITFQLKDFAMNVIQLMIYYESFIDFFRYLTGEELNQIWNI